MDQRLVQWLKKEFRWRLLPAQRDFNFASGDGHTIAQVRLRSEGLRDLRDGPVQQVVNRLASRGVIVRERKRSVALRKFSRTDWAELLTAWRAVYEPIRFVDVTRRTGGAEGLLARLRRHPPAGDALALGGVAA